MQVIFILLAIILIVYLYFLAIEWFFANAALPVLQLGSVLYTLLILVNYIRAVVEGFSGKLPSSKSRTPTPPEPAYKNYFFKKAYLDYSDIVKQALHYNYQQSEQLFKWNVSLVANPMWFITWPLTVTLFGVFGVAAVAAGVMFGVFGIIHLLIVGIACTAAYVVALYLRSIEWVSMIWRRINYVCPHSECYKPISLPVYICPNCGELHRRLVPGSYGIFRRRCKCDSGRLPTLALLGRRKLEAQCPHCSRPLSKEIGTATNIHVPLVGGASAGKTNYLIATVIAIDADSKVHQRQISFPEDRDQRVFDVNKALFEQGRPVAKTKDLSPDSFLMRLVEPSGRSSLLYIYDAAGELYADSADVRRLQKYFEYVDGVLFLIDPFSIGQVRTDYAKRIVEVADDLRPSNELPQDVYDRMITTWRDFSKSKRGIRKTPFAVVITKTDAFDLSTSIGSESSSIRQWLMRSGEGNLVRSIEKDFDTVHYFASSALGHLPTEQNAFAPRGVLAPAQWLLNHRAVKVIGEAETGVSWKSERLAYAFGILIVTILFTATGFGIAEVGQKLLASFYQSQGIVDQANPNERLHETTRPTVLVPNLATVPDAGAPIPSPRAAIPQPSGTNGEKSSTPPSHENSKPSPRPLPSASLLSGKWQVLLPRSSGSETQDRIEMTLSNQSSTSLSGERFYIKGSGGTGDRIEIKGSWDPAQRRVELKESMDSSKPWEAATRGIFVGILSEDGSRLDGEWTPYSGAVANRSFTRVR